MKMHRDSARRSGLVALLAATLILPACGRSTGDGNDAAVAAPAAGKGLAAVVAGDHRSAENKARDVHRHPVGTLTFFGIRPDMTVVELWPFGGWYTEVLAPYVRDKGVYYAAGLDPASTEANDQNFLALFDALLAARPDMYSKVRKSVLAADKMEVAPEGTADLVVSFRNIHNWAWSGMHEQVFAAAFKALKPGGVLGIVEHRHSDPDFAPLQRGQGYAGEEWTIRQVEAAGFRLDGRSDINDNPKDTKDYPRGVWTLPPNLAMGDVDRAKYEAIGESDRFTLRFVKPVE